MTTLKIGKTTARRFVLGKQGLWPGRRWQGLEGAAQALRSIEALQMDPLNIVARSHDLAMYGRVLDYQPEFLDELLYQRRQFFDYGGGLFIYPMAELPYWRLHMQRTGQRGRVAEVVAAHPEVVEQMRQAVCAGGPLGNRDFSGGERAVQGNYRGTRHSSIALYYLWLKGELMIHHRKRFERLYDLRERIAPEAWNYAAPVEEAEAFFAHKALAFLGLASERGWCNTLADYIQRKVSKEEGHAWLERLMAAGEALPVDVETSTKTLYVLAEDAAILETLEAGNVPDAWQPLQTTTLEEAVILAPLEIVSARGRASWLFDFEYIWEVYKPVEQRRWGYYTMPVLFDDRLVSRLDIKLDRKSGVLNVLGYWPETWLSDADAAYRRALVRGLRRLADMVGAINIQPEEFRQ